MVERIAINTAIKANGKSFLGFLREGKADRFINTSGIAILGLGFCAISVNLMLNRYEVQFGTMPNMLVANNTLDTIVNWTLGITGSVAGFVGAFGSAMAFLEWRDLVQKYNRYRRN
jgi:hypothetical protein